MSAANDTALASFGLADDPKIAVPADVCLLVEGTYPFVSGGVSSWVHDIICGHPELTFAVLYVGSYPGAHGEPRFKLPPNVVGLHRVFCQDAALAPLDGAGRASLREQIHSLRVAMDARPAKSRVLAGLERMHVEGEAGTDVLAALASNDLTLPELMHGRSSFQLLTTIAERVAPDAPFLDLFWHYRAIFAPVLRLLAAPTVVARCYHAVATGYAGLLAALWSHRTGRPLMVTEHGIYARERDMELARADWIRDEAGGVSEPRSTWAPRILAAPAPLVVVLQGAVAHRLRPGAPHHHAVGRRRILIDDAGRISNAMFKRDKFLVWTWDAGSLPNGGRLAVLTPNLSDASTWRNAHSWRLGISCVSLVSPSRSSDARRHSGS